MRSAPAMVVALLVAGCGPGNGDGLDANGRPVGEGGGGGPLTATFSSIQSQVFTPNCAISGCHAGATAPHGLRLDAGSSYALLVGVPSDEVPTVMRVAPGDPDGSYVIQKLEGRAAVGERMPFGGPYLSQTTIDVVRQWIADGALADSGAPETPPTVVSVTPADDAALDAFPAQIEIIFSQDMDPSLVTSASVLLTASGGDGSFDDGNETAIVPVAVSLAADNARRAIVDLSGVAAGVDSYELRLTAAAPVAIADLLGNVLDGNGDGDGGDDFVSHFTVADVLPNLESIQDKVFTPLCAECHRGPAGGALPGGQDLSSAAASYANLVEVASVEAPALLRVSPGAADESYLVQKLEGTAGVGERMPLGGAPLAPATIEAIRAWIDAGAPAAGGGADTTPPVVNLDAIAAEVDGTVTLTAQASDDVRVVAVEFFVDGVSLGADVSAPYAVAWDTTAAANGPHALSAEATDAAGNVGHAAPVAVDVFNDVTPPTVSIDSPLAGAVVTAVATLSASADDDVAVTAVDFLVDAVAIGTDANGAPFTLDWDSTTVADGAHALTARAHDAAGHATLSVAVAITVVNDVTPPTASITAPADGATVSGSVAVTVSASDDVRVSRVDLLVDGVVTGSDAAAPFQILWDSVTSGDGAHTLTARAVDAAGNEGSSAPVGVTVDNSCTGDVQPPTVSLTTPAPGLVSGTVALSATADDAVGVTPVLFFADDALVATAASAPYDADWDSTAGGDGPVSLTARASDACGNEATSAAVAVTVDNGALAVIAVDPAAGAVVSPLPAAITIGFDDDVDAATVGVGSFILVRSGGDGVFDNGNDVAIVAPVVASAAGASMDLSAVTSAFDTYRVRLLDSITDLAGNALDGDGDGTAGGDYTYTFTVAPTYTNDTQPIYFDKCDPCHTGDGFGGHNIGINYEDAFLPTSVYPECRNAGLLVGQCTIVLIQEGEMPFGAGCTGNPALDGGNAACLTQAQQDTIQAWIDAGMPE
jgi:methionine-rich copper-binding protein CopC